MKKTNIFIPESASPKVWVKLPAVGNDTISKSKEKVEKIYIKVGK